MHSLGTVISLIIMTRFLLSPFSSSVDLFSFCILFFVSGEAKVSFVFDSYVRHWQHQTRHLVTIPKNYTYEALAVRVKNLFSDEIGPSRF